VNPGDRQTSLHSIDPSACKETRLFTEHLLLIWHVAAGIFAGGVAFVGWRFGRAWGVRGTILFLAVFGLLYPRHYGALDGLAAITLILLALAIQLAQGEEAKQRAENDELKLLRLLLEERSELRKRETPLLVDGHEPGWQSIVHRDQVRAAVHINEGDRHHHLAV
jgi:hypothetical protein